MTPHQRANKKLICYILEASDFMEKQPFENLKMLPFWRFLFQNENRLRFEFSISQIFR